MKKYICLFLALAMIFVLAACSGLPAFDENALTEAEGYAYAAISDFTLSNDYDFVSAKVMLTDDLSADLKDASFDKWDVSDVTAVVVAKVDKAASGSETTSDTAVEATADDSAPAAETATPAPATTEKTIVFLMNSDKDTVYSNSGLSGAAAAGSAGDSPDSDDSEDVDDLRRTLASTELEQEKLVESNIPKEDAKPDKKAAADEFVAFVTNAEAKIAEDDQYWYSAEYLNGISGNSALVKWDGYARECARLENRIKVLDSLGDMTGDERAAAIALLDSNEELNTQRTEIFKYLRQVEAQLATYTTENAAALEAVIAKLNELEGQEDYLYNEDYLKLCIANETCNQYDVLIRQKYVYESSLAALDECEKTEDMDERNYILELSATRNDRFTTYTNQLKVYIQCVLNQENFKAENAADIEAYETSLAAAKKAAVDDYEKDIDYIKVGVKYEDLNKQLSAHEKAVNASKADADAIKTENDEKLKKLGDDEAERLNDIEVTAEKQALFELLSGDLTSVSEFEAAKGQWGDLHPDFTAYQNAHLERPSNNSGSYHSSNKNNNDLSGDGANYDKDDPYYSANDANGDGKINDEEFNNAFDDYLNDLLGS